VLCLNMFLAICNAELHVGMMPSQSVKQQYARVSLFCIKSGKQMWFVTRM